MSLYKEMGSGHDKDKGCWCHKRLHLSSVYFYFQAIYRIQGSIWSVQSVLLEIAKNTPHSVRNIDCWSLLNPASSFVCLKAPLSSLSSPSKLLFLKEKWPSSYITPLKFCAKFSLTCKGVQCAVERSSQTCQRQFAGAS